MFPINKSSLHCRKQYYHFNLVNMAVSCAERILTSAQNCVGSWLGGEVGGGGEVGADTNECDLTATGWLAARQTFQIMNGGS